MRKLGAPIAVALSWALALSTAAAGAVVLPASAAPLSPNFRPSFGQEPGAKLGDNASHPRAAPQLRIRTIARGLDVPWDVRSIGGGQLLFTQRDRASLTRIDAGGGLHGVRFPSRRIWVSG